MLLLLDGTICSVTSTLSLLLPFFFFFSFRFATCLVFVNVFVACFRSSAIFPPTQTVLFSFNNSQSFYLSTFRVTFSFRTKTTIDKAINKTCTYIGYYSRMAEIFIFVVILFSQFTPRCFSRQIECYPSTFE